MEKMVYSVREAAQVLGVSINKMYELVKCNGFPAVHLSERKTVIPKEGLALWLANGGFRVGG